MNDPRPDLSITLMSGPQDGVTYTFTLNAHQPLTITIGRREECEIKLNYDSQVSRLHARLTYDPRDIEYMLEDLGSRNGTFVGVQRIEDRHPIQPGDIFRIGRTHMRLDSLPQPTTPVKTLDPA